LPTANSSNEQKTGNRLLDALSPRTLAGLQPHFETVPLETNKVLHQPGAKADYVFFPTSGVISIIVMTADGAAVETAMAGKEGMFSVSVVLEDDCPSQKALVQLGGSAIRMRSSQIEQAVAEDAEVRRVLLRYAQAILTTSAQAAACNRLHQLEQRCARWLLSARDRAESDTFHITHEFLATMLGVRRPGVTVAVQNFRDSGLIAYSHGTMSVLDRAGLEKASCECYQVIQDEFRRLLG
jgi:CRP-like cAMP-binding protein